MVSEHNGKLVVTSRSQSSRWSVDAILWLVLLSAPVRARDEDFKSVVSS